MSKATVANDVLVFENRTNAKDLQLHIENLKQMKMNSSTTTTASSQASASSSSSSPEQNAAAEIVSWQNTMGRNYLMVALRVDVSHGCLQLLVDLFKEAGGDYLKDALVKHDKHSRNCIMIAASIDLNHQAMRVLLQAYQSCGDETMKTALQSTDTWGYNGLVIGVRLKLNLKAMRLLLKSHASCGILSTVLKELAHDTKLAHMLSIIAFDTWQLLISQLKNQKEVDEIFNETALCEKPEPDSEVKEDGRLRLVDPDECNFDFVHDRDSFDQCRNWYLKCLRYFTWEDQMKPTPGELQDFLDELRSMFTEESTDDEVFKLVSNCFERVVKASPEDKFSSFSLLGKTKVQTTITLYWSRKTLLFVTES